MSGENEKQGKMEEKRVYRTFLFAYGKFLKNIHLYLNLNEEEWRNLKIENLFEIDKRFES